MITLFYSWRYGVRHDGKIREKTRDTKGAEIEKRNVQQCKEKNMHVTKDDSRTHTRETPSKSINKRKRKTNKRINKTDKCGMRTVSLKSKSHPFSKHKIAMLIRGENPPSRDFAFTCTHSICI